MSLANQTQTLEANATSYSDVFHKLFTGTILWNRDKRKTAGEMENMNKIAKTAAAATFTLALIAGAGTSAMAHERKPACPTATVVQAKTPAEYTALTNAYQQYTNATETAYNTAVTDANAAVVKEVSAQKQALEAAKLAARAAKAAVKVAKDAVKAANDAVKAEPTNAYKLIALEAARVAAKAAKADAKAAKDVVEAQRTLLRAQHEAEAKSRNAIREATEHRSEHMKGCKAPMAPKGPGGKKPKKD
jgi:hypothetical protein